MEVRKEDYFQSVLMSAPREKTYSQIQIAEKQRINDFLNGKRLSSKLPHHTQLPEEPSELEIKLALLQLDMIRRNAGRTEVERTRNANREDPWNQVKAFFSGSTTATLAQWLKDKAEQLGLESWHDAPANIAQKAFTKEKYDIQYDNQAKKELRADNESEEGWKEFKADALGHHLLHRAAAEAKPGDGTPKLSVLTRWAELKRDSQPDRDSRRNRRRAWTLCSRKSSALPATLTNRRGLETRRPRTRRLRQTRSGVRHLETTWCCKRLFNQSMVGQSIRFLVETLLPDVDATFTSFENVELWQPGRWASSGFARATFHPDRTRAEWEFALAEHKWAGDEGILARHGLLLGNGDALLFNALRAEGRVVAMIPQRVHNHLNNHPWPIQFTAPPLPQGEAPKEEQIYASGQRQFNYLFDPPTTPPSLMDLPCVQTWQNEIAEKLEEPQ
eukprot:4523606-Pleurochrysis_carterae.AAC.2